MGCIRTCFYIGKILHYIGIELSLVLKSYRRVLYINKDYDKIATNSKARGKSEHNWQCCPCPNWQIWTCAEISVFWNIDNFNVFHFVKFCLVQFKRKEKIVYLFVILPTSDNSTFIGDFWSYCGCSDSVVPYIFTELSSCMLLVIFIIYEESKENLQ